MNLLSCSDQQSLHSNRLCSRSKKSFALEIICQYTLTGRCFWCRPSTHHSPVMLRHSYIWRILQPQWLFVLQYHHAGKLPLVNHLTVCLPNASRAGSCISSKKGLRTASGSVMQ